MKEIFFNKKIIIGICCIFTGIIVMILSIYYETKDNQLGRAKDAIENIFFFLPNEKYDNLNEISDYCKVSLVYNTSYLQNDVLLSKEDYNTIVKKNGIKAYSKENILNSVKSILGDNISIKFDLNEDDEYSFTYEDECKYGNENINTLSYNEDKGYLYSIADEEENNIKLFIKWEKPEINGDDVVLQAKALVAVKNAEGKYDIYADNNLEHKAGDAKKSNLKSKVEKLYYKSKDYIFNLKKVKDKYIWISYEVIDRLYNDDYIVD